MLYIILTKLGAHELAHVRKADAEAKFWLYPDVTIAYTTGFDARTLAALRRIVEARRSEIEEAWHDHFR